MIEAVMFWNEPNNKSHWDFEVDPGWSLFAEMIRQATAAVKQVNPAVTRVLGGMSPIDQQFVQNLEERGALEHLDAIAVHGFPLDWNLWKLDEWPDKIREIQQVTSLPVWVSEVGISTFGAEEVQVFGLKRTAELLTGLAPRIHWYSLYDLPQDWPATTRHREAEGSSYYRHFSMGLIREDGTPKPALDLFRDLTPELGICQWFHFEDHRLDDAVKWLRELGVKKLRTGLSWADSFRPGAEQWFDRQMEALAEFDVTATFCFTPEHRGIQPHHTSAPLCLEEYAEFCCEMVRRYAPAAPALASNNNGHGREILPAITTAGRPQEFPWNGGNSYADPAGIEALRYILRPGLAPQPLKTVAVCTHPDDEAIGMASRFGPLGSNVSLIYTTDGSPFDLTDARQAGFPTREAYSAARRQELHSALTIAGALPAEIRFLRYPDQQASFNLVEMTRELAAAFEEIRPDVVMTHPYEGGHPDHDATAFAVHSACHLLRHERGWTPVILEFSCFYNDAGSMKTGGFLPAKNAPVSRIMLTPEQQQTKRQMMESYTTQEGILRDFNVVAEAFRPAPAYNFNRPPHEGPLYYEMFDWGMTGDRWARLARAAADKLFMDPVQI